MSEIYQVLKSTFKRPVYSNTSIAFRSTQALVFGGFVALFLIVFEPFQISTYGKGWQVFALGFGSITFGVMFILNVIIPQFFYQFFENENWMLWKEVFYSLLNVLTIGAVNSAFFLFMISGEFNWSIYFRFQFYTLCVGLLPIFVITLLRERYDYAKYAKTSAWLNKQRNGIRNKSKDIQTVITLTSKNKNENINIKIDNLLFIRSMDNYLEIHTKNEKYIIRNTLKQLEEDFKKYHHLFRCHKSYLVNFNHVEEVKGNAQGYKLSLYFTDIKVPVSRKLNEEIKKRLLT